MNDNFIYEKIPKIRESRAGIRIAKGAKNVRIGEMNLEGIDNALVCEGDAENVNIDSVNIKNGEGKFFMNNMIDSKINNVTIKNSSTLNRTRERFNQSLSREKNDTQRAMLMGNHAMFLKTHLIFEEALDLLKSSLDIFKKQNNEENMSISYANIGVIFKSLGHYDKAISCYELALTIDKKRRRTVGILMNNVNLGIIHDLKKEPLEAIKKYEICIPLATGENTTILSQIYTNMAMAYTDINPEKSIQLYRSAIDLDIKNNNVYNLAFSYRNLGILLKKTGKIGLSTSYIIKASELFHYIGNLREESLTKSHLNIRF